MHAALPLADLARVAPRARLLQHPRSSGPASTYLLQNQPRPCSINLPIQRQPTPSSISAVMPE